MGKLKSLLYICNIFLVLIVSPHLGALTNENVIIHMRISNLTHGQPPIFLDRKILFSYENKNYIRRVGIAFGYDHYRTVHPFVRNNNNIFVYIANIPQGSNYLNYRIIVDGLWINDPYNPNVHVSREGFTLSTLTIPDYLREQAVSPLVQPDRTVKFFYTGKSKQNIFLSGNFNNWDPFMLRMKEDKTDPGYYSISLRISPGKHYYTFIADGKEIPDPQNPHKVIDETGKRVSFLDIP